MTSYITLTPDSLPESHICCAISDKKCAKGYQAKKHWLKAQYINGYRFHRLDERGKVFIEYGPGKQAWMPVVAPEWMVMGCFWVSGKFKKQGHAKAMLKHALDDAKTKGFAGLVSVAGAKKMHFQSDGKWLKRQGFQVVDTLESGFELLTLNIENGHEAIAPKFADTARHGLPISSKGIDVYYSDRCPFTDFHINVSLKETCGKRGLTCRTHKLETLKKAQNAPSPSTIFSLFLDGQFLTTDLSACMDSRFDKVIKKAKAR